MPHLIKITKGSLVTGHIPSPWRRAKVIFIPKVGKKDTTDPKSFRPISLTSFILKTMEKVIDNYLRTVVLERMPLHPSQHAYRAGRSTDTALYQLTNEIQKSLEVKEITICAFLDIEGAFDNTSHDAVEKALKRKGVHHTISRWMCELLKSRIAETKVGNKTIKVSTTRGCPQGGVLSPLMWSLVVDELLEKITNCGIRCIGYADDIVLIARGKFESTLCEIIQKGLSITRDWCLSVGLNINPNKTTIITFTRKRLLTHMKPIRLAGVTINQKQEVKYLGVTLDSKLTWKKHAEVVVSKATRALMVCRSLAGKTWGCKPKTLRWMYTMMVRPIITYGAIAWADRTKLQATKKKLEKVQRLACICITGAMRTCPTAALEVILDLTPLHIVVEQAAQGTIMRIVKEGIGKNKCIGIREHNSLSRALPFLETPRDEMIKKYNFVKNFAIRLSSKKEWTTESNIYPFSEHTLKWYTDGSRTSDGTGAGVFGPRTKYYEPMGKLCSIFQAEINAIKRCVQINLDRHYRRQDIAILSDSQAAIKALNAYAIRSKLVWECLNDINKLGKYNKVTLYWVPGHVGIPGNEEADNLAKTGAETPFIGPEPFCGLGEHTIREELRRGEETKRRNLWRELPKLRQSKMFLGNYHRKRSRTCIELTKNRLRMLTGLLTGHCKLRGHLTKIGLEDNNVCRFCNEAGETPEHILGKCGALNQIRFSNLGAHQIEKESFPSLNPLQILQFVKDSKLEDIL